MHRITSLIQITLAILFPYSAPVFAAESFTDASCNAVTATMTSCARRWDSIRQSCTNSYGSNSIWPGPCECSYYANDMPCFDEHALCAAQVWTQVPQWFRDGVTSCLMKDASYTVRAELGSIQNPFLITGIAGNATKTTATATGTAQTGNLPSAASATTTHATEAKSSQSLQTGAKIGIGFGLGIGVLALIIITAYLFTRRRRPEATDQGEELDGVEKYEVHAKDAKIFEAGPNSNVSKTELPGAMGPELEGEKGAELAGEWGYEMAGDIGQHACGSGERYELEGLDHVVELPTRKM